MTRAARRLATGVALALAAPAAAAPCELHVWGAGHKPKKSIFVKSAPQPAYDPADPLAFANLFGPEKRAAALSDEGLRRLFPAGTEVTIVHHDAMIDLDRQPVDAMRAPLAGRAAGGCQADLVLDNLYAVFAPPGSHGLLVDALAGKDRLAIDFWFQQVGGGLTKPLTVRRTGKAPLPQVASTSPEMRDALATASEAILDAFARTVAARRGG